MMQTRSRCFDSPSDNRNDSVILKCGCSSLERHHFIPSVLVEYNPKMCSSRKKSKPPHRRSMKILRGLGISQAKNFKENYQAKLKGVFTPKKPPMRGVRSFSLHNL